MGLTVALDDNGKAEGQMFWDDGQSIGKYEFPRVPMHQSSQRKHTTEAQHALVGNEKLSLCLLLPKKQWCWEKIFNFCLFICIIQKLLQTRVGSSITGLETWCYRFSQGCYSPQFVDANISSTVVSFSVRHKHGSIAQPSIPGIFSS
jgi:hypothetical protein